MLLAAFGPNHLAVAVAEVNPAHAFIRSGNLSGTHALLEHTAHRSKRTLCIRVHTWPCAWNAGSGHTAEADQLFGESIGMFDATGRANDLFTAEVLLAYARFLKPYRKKDATALKRRANAIRSHRP